MQLTELQALQNSADDLGLTVHQKYINDKRKTIGLYYANKGKETVSPVLDYDQLNHFLLGWHECKKHTN